MAKPKKTRKVNHYELPLELEINAEKLVLAADPGSKNFGIALVGIRNRKIKVYANAVLMTPVDDLKSFNQASSAFMSEIEEWMSFAPDGVIAERFQTRGHGGPLIEQVSAMLGLIKGAYPKTPIKLTIASAWKNRVQKRFGIDLKEVYPEVGVQPHQLDAALIGVFGLEEGLGHPIDYSIDNIITQVERTSLIGLRRRKSQ